MKQIAKYMSVIAVVGAVLAPSFAMALPQPTVPVGGSVITASSIVRIINDVVSILLTVSVVIGVGYFIYGAIKFFVMSKPDEGKDIMKRAVIGVALIMGIGLILNSIAALINRGLNIG